MPLFWLSLAFLCGILLGEWLNWSVTAWLSLAALALLALVLPRTLPRFFPGAAHHISRLTNRAPRFFASLALPLPFSLLFLAGALGAARYQSVLPKLSPDFIAWYNDSEVPYIIEGMLVAPPDERDTYANLRVRAEKLRPVNDLLFTPVDGLLLAKIPPGGGWRYGDRVRLEGSLETPPENEEFSYRGYLARQGIYSYFACRACISCSLRVTDDCAHMLLRDQGNPLLALIYGLKARALETIYRLFPDPEASLLAGILIGVETGIPEEVQQAFKDTGTSHIIAISGFNFAVLAGLFAALFGRALGKWRGALAVLIVMTIYAVLVGGEAAVVRAAIMSGLTLFAGLLGRRQDGLNTLTFVAAVMALFNPYVLWDVSFQLSFMATLGLLLYAEPLTQAFIHFATPRLTMPTAQRLVGPAGEYLLFTLAAQVTTLPVIIYHFQRLSLASLLVNPLILPAQPPVMVLGGLAVVLGLIYQPLGQLVAYLAWPFTVYTIRVVELTSFVPSAAISLGQVSLLAVTMFYVLLFTLTFAGPRLRSRFGERLGASSSKLVWVGLLVMGGLTVVVWQMALSAPDGRLHLTVLDVGSGDGLLIQTPTGRTLLVDGGTSPSRLSDALGRRLPLMQRSLDYLVVAAAGDEQLAALPRTLERFPPENVLWAGPPLGSYYALQLRERLVEVQIPVVAAQTGQRLNLGAGAALHVLTVGRKGSVLLLEWGNFSVLLPIGLDFELMESLQDNRSLGHVTALLLVDCGFAPLNSPEWIDRWNPQMVLLSVAAADADGRPDPETLETVKGYTLLRTDRDGWIHLSTDGESLWVEVER